jgi:hypothetical protein
MEELVPTKFELAQNYPNPFREVTTIKYCVPEKMQISLEVFDSRGNKVKTLVDEIKEAGTYKVEFSTKNGSTSGGNTWDLPSGEYLYKLESRDYFESKKMVLMK